MNSELRIRTPEGVVFAYTLAGPVTRCMAAVIDLLIVAALNRGIGLLLSLLGLVAEDLMQGVMIVAFFVVSVGYAMLFEWLDRGQTLGKRVFRLRVMDARGLRLQFHQVIMRNLLRMVDMLPAFYLLGGLISLLSPRGQRLGDLAAGTIVVHHPKPLEPDLDQLLAGKFNSLRGYPHLEARLRQQISPQEARLALQALLRRDELDPAARVAFFGELADHFRAAVPFPDELTETMADEQYIRNVVDILFRTRKATEQARL